MRLVAENKYSINTFVSHASPTGGAERRETGPVRPPRSERPHSHQDSRRGHRSPLRRHSGRSRSPLQRSHQRSPRRSRRGNPREHRSRSLSPAPSWRNSRHHRSRSRERTRRAPAGSRSSNSHGHRSRSSWEATRQARHRTKDSLVRGRHRRRRARSHTSSDTDASEGRQRWRSSSSSSSQSSGASSSSRSTSPTTSEDSRRGRSSRRGRHSHRHRHRHGHRFTWTQGSSPFVCCAPPPPDRVIARIRKGKYVNFDLLLPSTDDSLPVQGVRASGYKKGNKADRPPKRRVSDFQSWMEAWNTFLLITAHTSQDRCLELLKYQTLIGHLFSAYPTSVCLRYDQLFRRTTARDHSLQWDTFKEDLLVWCTTFRPLRSTLAARLGPPSASASGGNSLQRATHSSAGVEICKRYNAGACTRGDECKFAHICWHASCRGSHSAKACPLRNPTA